MWTHNVCQGLSSWGTGGATLNKIHFPETSWEQNLVSLKKSQHISRPWKTLFRNNYATPPPFFSLPCLCTVLCIMEIVVLYTSHCTKDYSNPYLLQLESQDNRLKTKYYFSLWVNITSACLKAARDKWSFHMLTLSPKSRNYISRMITISFSFTY